MTENSQLECLLYKNGSREENQGADALPQRPQHANLLTLVIPISPHFLDA